jgi:hypothetical protein
LKSQTKEWTDDSTQEGVDLADGHTVLPHHLALRTQSTSWGRLYAALFFVGLTIIPDKATSIDGNGWWTGFVCCHRYSPSMFVRMP